MSEISIHRSKWTKKPKSMMKKPRPLVGTNVLIVEDEMLQAWDIGDVISELGGTPKVVFRFDQAVEAIKDKRFDCAILDVNLSGTLSFALAENLQNRGIPVLFCTAYDKATTLLATKKPIPQLNKPVEKRDLRDAVLGLIKDAQTKNHTAHS